MVDTGFDGDAVKPKIGKIFANSYATRRTVVSEGLWWGT